MKVQDYQNKDILLSDVKKEVVELLKNLIDTPSISKEEDKTADLIEKFLLKKDCIVNRKLNNVWVKNMYFDITKPSILLNSHHDTVKPAKGYSKNPFEATIINDKLYGLGSNDAGASLVSLLAAFLWYYKKENLNFNLIFSATAEEEISGANGIECIIDQLKPIDFAIVGEPTLMQMAIAEKGLMVLDCKSKGESGHAARDEGENAIYNALKDITWFQSYQFPKQSEILGPVKMNVTVINAGSQHNVIPDQCDFVIDIRTTDAYTHEEIISLIKENISSELNLRSNRLKPSFISKNHPFVIKAKESGVNLFGSSTLSDQALMPWPSVKIGPGDSARSHSADEFIYLKEIETGIDTYVQLLKNIL